MRRVLLVLVVALLGCGSSDVEVRGKVSYQGQPVKSGAILFEDPTGAMPPGYSPIEAGAYQLRVQPGERLVRITATEATGKMLEGGMGQTPEMRDLIPAQFNTESTLRRTVETGRTQTLEFELK